MAKIQLDVPDDLHREIKREKINLEDSGETLNLKELYYKVIRKGIEAIKKEKATS